MRNPNLNISKNPRSSKFLGNRRKRFLNSQKESIVLPDVPHITLQNKKTDIYCRMFHEGFFRVKYHSQQTGRSAFGYGPTLEVAFEAMNRNFTEKYHSHA